MLYVGCVVLVLTCIYIYYLLRPSGDFKEGCTIDSFIDKDTDDEFVAVFTKNKYTTNYLTEGRQVLIIYGTEYGCAEEVAKLLYDRILELNISDGDLPLQPRLLNAKHFNIVDFAREQLCFIIISTSGDGVPPSDARMFYEHMLSISEVDLSHLKFSLLALGDSNYPLFCKTGRTLYDRLVTLGCQSIVDRHDVDAEDWSVINTWLDGVITYLDTVDIQPALDYLQLSDITEDRYSRSRPFLATLKEKHLLTVCMTPEDKETIHCEFTIEGSNLTWSSGDALGIYPQNNPPEVDRLLKALNCCGSTSFEKPSWAYQADTDLDTGAHTLHTCLMKYYDLKSVKPELLQQLSTSVTLESEKKQLADLLNDGLAKTNASLYQYISGREVADILLDFSSHQLSWKQILKNMRALQPRYYSISSSPKEDSTTVCVTAAIVRYETQGLPRTGVTTTYLSDRISVWQKCPVFMSRNPDFRLPSDASIPVILIGPGTGLAPFMAFIQERALEPTRGPTWLYFGCRHKDKDYLYRSKLEKWCKDGIIQLRTAFSRDQSDKVYVQDLLREDKLEIWRLIDQCQASLYVCGDAKYMANDVNKALIQIVQSVGHQSESEAVTYIQQLEYHGRYQKDVWVV